MLMRADTAWHPVRPTQKRPVVVSALVDGGPEALFAEPVARDRLGRITVAFPFATANAHGSRPTPPLALLLPMAGALHGFVPGHRHGDICRVLVHHPFAAEVLGAQYRDDRRINTEFRRRWRSAGGGTRLRRRLDRTHVPRRSTTGSVSRTNE